MAWVIDDNNEREVAAPREKEGQGERQPVTAVWWKEKERREREDRDSCDER